MPNEVFFIVGGAELAAVVIALIILKCKNGKGDIASATDDQLVVSQLSSSDITGWFKEKNPDGKFTNIVMLANSETLNKMKLPSDTIKTCEELLSESKNVVIQAIFDKEKDEVVLTRAVIFDTMSEKLGKLLNDNNGVLILE